MNSFKKIFAFTFRQATKGKGFRILTVAIALIGLLLPVVIMSLVELNSEEEIIYTYSIKNVFVYDEIQGADIDYSLLNGLGDENYSSVIYQNADSAESAINAAALADGYAIALLLTKSERGVNADIVVPDNSKLQNGDSFSFSEFMGKYYSFILLLKSGITEEQLAAISTNVSMTDVTNIHTEDPYDPIQDNIQAVKMIISMILPVLIILIMYFLLIFYGQGIATSIVMEKSSKLMDTFLLSVKPIEMILGKTLALSITGFIQAFIWFGSAFLGLKTGVEVVKIINPDTKMMIVQFFDSLSELAGVFTLGGFLMTVLFIFFGFIMYCSLAAIGGAISEKQEDLSTNNLIFTMVLVISYMVTFFSSALFGESSSAKASAVDFIPFTSIFTMPSKILLGDISYGLAFLSLFFLIVATLLIGMLAGKLYKVMALYKGNFPGLKKIVKMLTEK